MALIFRQTITTNLNEVYALHEAISVHLFKPLRNDKKIKAAEFLAIDPLKKVGGRLYTRYMRERQHRQFTFHFSPQEVVAITLNIRNSQANPFLEVVLGKVQQRSLNLEDFIELNYKS